jgi:glycine/D-amino acid oxidase-like deaminating enzyme
MRGIATTVIEKSASASGTTAHGEGNILVSDKSPGPELEMALHAASTWPRLAKDLSDELGDDFPSIEFEPKGGIVAATTVEGAGPLLAFAEKQRAAGIEANELTISEALSLEPYLNPAMSAAVHYPQDSQVQPVIAAEALLASARRHGAAVEQSIRLHGPILNREGALVGILTDRGDFRADAVVIAAGPWSGDVAATLGVTLPVLPRHGMILVTSKMTQRVFHKVYDADYVGAVGSGEASLQTSGVVESTASGNVIIGSSRQLLGFDDRLRVDTISEVAARAIRLFPFLADQALIRTYGGFRPFMPDHLPLIGPDHRLSGLWHATGHEGAGIGLGPVTGELLAAIMTGTRPPVDPAPFSPARPSLASSLVRAA